MNATELGRMYRTGDLPGLLALCRTIAEKQPVEKVQGPDDLALNLCAQMGTLEQEELWVVLLNTRNEVLRIAKVYKGSLNTSLVRVGELFREAIRENAAAVIVAHNHPSGDPTPSPEDMAVTRAIVEAGKLLDIEVLDHIITGKTRWVSLKAMGMMS